MINIVGEKITRSLKRCDICCKGGEEVFILNNHTLEHINRVQQLLDWYGFDLKVKAWQVDCNSKIENMENLNSKHIEGIATDFYFPKSWKNFNRIMKRKLINDIRKEWFYLGSWTGGFALYDDHFHIDSRDAVYIGDFRKKDSY